MQYRLLNLLIFTSFILAFTGCEESTEEEDPVASTPPIAIPDGTSSLIPGPIQTEANGFWKWEVDE